MESKRKAVLSLLWEREEGRGKEGKKKEYN